MAKSAKLSTLILVIRVMIISILAASVVILIILVGSSCVKTVQGHGVGVTELTAITSSAGTATTESQETLNIILVCSPIVLVGGRAYVELSRHLLHKSVDHVHICYLRIVKIVFDLIQVLFGQALVRLVFRWLWVFFVGTTGGAFRERCLGVILRGV